MKKTSQELGVTVSPRRSLDLDSCGVDIESIQSTILTRINQALPVSSSDSGPSVDSASKAMSTRQFMQQVLPVIVTSVALAVGEIISKVLEKKKDSTPSQEHIKKLQRNVLLLKYENDRQEQYSRQETVRIVGLKEQDGEDEEKKVLDLYKEEEVPVVAEDISVVHRTGQKKKGACHVLVCFVSRKKKREVMKNRRNLKDKESYKQVFLNDDMTALRFRLMTYIKTSGKFGRVWASEGKVFVQPKQPPGASAGEKPEVFVVQSPDDLFDIGLDVDFAKLGLDDLIVCEE
ncbi:hypothetical protein ACOMHN_015209 [Nucella lapillus]